MSEVGRALQLIDLGRYDQAAANLSAVVAAEPDNADALRALSSALVGLGRNQDALEASRSALALAPDEQATHLAVWWAAHNAGEFPLAAASAESAVRLAPHDAAGHRASAVSLAHLPGRRRDAVRAGEEAVRLDPGSADTWNSLGYAWHRRSRRRAQDAYRQALARDPGHSLARQNLAALDVRRSPVAASRGLAEALAIDPTNKVARENFDKAIGYALARVAFIAFVLFRLCFHDAALFSIARVAVFLGLLVPFAAWNWFRLPAAARVSFGSTVAPGLGGNRIGTRLVVAGIALVVAAALVNVEHETLIGTLFGSGALVLAAGCISLSVSSRANRRQQERR